MFQCICIISYIITVVSIQLAYIVLLFIMKTKVLILISLLHLITATSIFYVTSDDQSDINNDCPIDHACHTLEYYLFNSSKYFKSNIQLYLLQGNHYINSNIEIHGLDNFSLVGSGVNNTVIECSMDVPILIIITGCVHAVIKNFTIGSQCGAFVSKGTTVLDPLFFKYQPPVQMTATIFMSTCYSTVMHSILIKRHGMLIINGLGNTTLIDIIHYYDSLQIFYEITDQNSSTNNVLYIINFKYYEGEVLSVTPKKRPHIIMMEFLNEYYSAEVQIKDTKFQSLNRIDLIRVRFLVCIGSESKVSFKVKNCQFSNNSGVPLTNRGLITVSFPFCEEIKIYQIFNESWLNATLITAFQIQNSSFINNTAYSIPATIMKLILLRSDWRISYFIVLNCTFANNYNLSLLQIVKLYLVEATAVKSISDLGASSFLCSITLENSTLILSGNVKYEPAIYCQDALLYLNGPLIITDFESKNSAVISLIKSEVVIHGCVKIFNNVATSLFSQKGAHPIQFKESLQLNISSSNFSAEIFTTYTSQYYDYTAVIEPYPLCVLQYVNDDKNLDHQFAARENINFSIIIHKTESHSLSNMQTTHCRWQSDSAFNTTSPLLVNQRFISDFDGWNDILNVHTQNTLCSCSDGKNINCTTDILGPIYPGQNAVFSLTLKNTKQNAITILLETINFSPLQCTIPTASTPYDISGNKCSNISYTLLSHSNSICELLFKQGIITVHGVKESYDKFYVKLLPCPPGFMFIQMRCQCDPILTLNKHVKDCDINDQTVLRSPNSWIFYNESLHTYRLSKSCPFQYCYHHSTKLHLDNPNLQCQFKRSGVLCGQCQQDLSTIFGSFDCQQCSNVYLFLIILIAASGILLVIIMLVLNMTVSEGTITPFILYVNILSIHNVPLYPSHLLVKPLYVFVSLTNLNLGIKTCFYNGMDDYAKAWLQFSFTVYLIVIIASIVIASRYSIVIQRLTLHKTVPVLATILLLSYTKVLQTVCDVLFLHSTITDYPSNVSRVMWSIDANVPLFGLHHSVLFAFSLLIFLLLILFTCLLLFGKTLRNFKISIHINPLLNAYNKSYKKNCCYWIGYELIIRCVLLVTLLAVNNSTINLIIGNSFLAMVQFNYQHPYQNPVNNFSQMVLNLNLLIIYSTSLIFPEDQGIRVVIVNTLVGCGVIQFMLMILINRFSFKCHNVNLINYVRHKLFNKKQLSDVDMLLLARQD